MWSPLRLPRAISLMTTLPFHFFPPSHGHLAPPEGSTKLQTSGSILLLVKVSCSLVGEPQAIFNLSDVKPQ